MKEKYLLKDTSGNIISTLDIQNKLWQIFKVVDGICQENNISYFLSDATCLEAVLKHNFFANTVTLEIGMMRPDYEQFLEIVSTTLPSDYIISCLSTDSKFTLGAETMRIGLKETYLKTKGWRGFNRSSFKGLFISIHVFDFTSSVPLINHTLGLINKGWLGILFILDLIYINFIPLKKLHLLWIRKISNHYQNSKNFLLTNFELRKSEYLPYSVLFFPTTVEFNNQLVLVPNKTNIYLNNKYGEYDNRPPLTNRNQTKIKKISLEHQKKHDKSKRGFCYALIIYLIALLLFNEFSFTLIGLATLILGVTLLYYINIK